MCFELNPDPDDPGRPVSVADLVEELSVALNHARFYGRAHRVVAEDVSALIRAHARLLRERDGQAVRVGCADGCLFVDGRPLLRADRAAQRLRPVLEAVGSGGISLGPGLAECDLQALFALAACRDLAALDVNRANALLAAEGARALALLEAWSAASRGPEKAPIPRADVPAERRLVVSEEVYEGLFGHLTEVMLRFNQGDLPFLEETKAQVEHVLLSLGQNAGSVFDSIGRETSRADLFQFRHSIRVSCLTLEFARALSGDTDLILRLGSAALLHDVGKRDVPPDVLRHPGRLEGDMLESMRRHPVHGARLLLRIPDTDPLSVAVAFSHHRLPGGGGYPETVHDGNLSLATRIIKICDVYEALTAERPYKPRMSPRQAFRLMMSMEGQFDRPLLHRFIRVVGIWPVGSRVRLAGGAVARVEAQTDSLDHPRLVPDGETEPVDPRTPRGADLGPILGFEEDAGGAAEPARPPAGEPAACRGP